MSSAPDTQAPTDTRLSQETPTPSSRPTPSDSVLPDVHSVEREVQRRLVSQPGCRFSSLVVHRIAGGVCVEGVVESEVEFNLARVLRTVDGIQAVQDRLVRRCRSPR